MIVTKARILATKLPIGCRGLATKKAFKPFRLSPEALDNLPRFEDEYDDTVDPDAYVRSAVTSVHMVDVPNQKISTIDSVATSPSGSIVHGKYGDLGEAAAAIPLEYLALLRPAADGAAALRTILSNSKHSGTGTVLVYGASTTSGLAISQLASTAGHAVIGVVDSDHGGNTMFMDSMKGIIPEPGTAVTESFALNKKYFADLVSGISTGDEGIPVVPGAQILSEFKSLFLDYSEMYPDTNAAAVGAEHFEFKYYEKDRELFEENMRAYLEQFPPGAPQVEKALFDKNFTINQYQLFRNKFWEQTTDMISGGTKDFSAPHVAKKIYLSPGELDLRTYPGAGPTFPYAFSVLGQSFPEGSDVKKGGPILGAIIVATPALTMAAKNIGAAKTLREKGEALQFLSSNLKGAFQAAASVVAQAKKVGAPVVVVGGSLPGLESAPEATKDDVNNVLAAMDINDEGKSDLNYWIQLYRANDFPFYADYAIFRASEVMAGPRQIVVAK